jgi:hypothetical protein
VRNSLRIPIGAAMAIAAALAAVPPAGADATGYLLNVTVRPGYNFLDADAALRYGYGICDKVVAGERYSQLIDEVGSEFNTFDYFQAAYLVNQAVNELCPAQIWQLRASAARYTPT